MNRTFRYRIYPTRRQAEALETQLAFACDLWNAALEQRIWAYRTWGERVGRKTQIHQLTELDRGEMNYVCAQMVLERLQLAFDAFFRRMKAGEAPGFPRYRAKQRFNTLSFRRNQGGAAIRDGRLRIQGVGHIRVKWHRELPDEPRQTRVTRRNGRWYVAFAVQVQKEPRKPTGREVGIDLGVRRTINLSTGENICGPRPRHTAASAVRRAQRKVARRQKGSHRRRKAIALLARQREREANQRRDFNHKASRILVDDFDLIAVEKLQIRNMVRGGRGLNREIHDQGWGDLLQAIASKAESAGVSMVAVDPRNTSRTCAACGVVDPASRRAEHFVCTSCGHAEDADINAAQNVLRLGRNHQALTAEVSAVV